jgi:ATP-dependent Lhr-like helicase
LGTLVTGSFVDFSGEAANERRQYCHSQVLALIKRRTLALLRKGVEPVEQVAFARFLAEWQGVGSGNRGVDAVLGTIEQLSGYPIPASAMESMILPREWPITALDARRADRHR